MDLDRSSTVSTSLPESLNCSSEISFNYIAPEKPKNKCKATKVSVETPTSSNSSKSSRQPPSPKIPESTGKFGRRIVSKESLALSIPDQRLETITENPLSRPTTVNTEVVQQCENSKTFKEYPHSTEGLDLDHVSPQSKSTASVGAVHLNTSRLSHISSSNASIFDDPSWLLENSKSSSDKIFMFMRNALPNFKIDHGKDHKWFMNSQHQKPANRTDIDYLKAKSSIRLQGSKPWSVKRSQSLQIIENERNRGLRNTGKTKTTLDRPKSLHLPNSASTA